MSHLISGRWMSGGSDAALPAIDPSTGKTHAYLADGTAADIDALERGRILMRFGQVILYHADELARIESQDTGRPRRVARADTEAVARYFEFYGGAADKVHGETMPFLDGFFVGVIHEPHGVTWHILPWNYPLQMFGRTLAPSLAMGNATVLKPAEEASASAQRLAALSREAGFPDGAINLVTGRGKVAGAALSAHPAVDFLSFTRPLEVGRLVHPVRGRAAQQHLGAGRSVRPSAGRPPFRGRGRRGPAGQCDRVRPGRRGLDP